MASSHLPRHFLSVTDIREAEARALFEQVANQKRGGAQGGGSDLPLQGQVWALLFRKPSTRTRVSFELAIRQLGGSALFLSAAELQLSRGEPMGDTACVLGRMVQGAIIRTFAQEEIETFARSSGIPTVNALTDQEHPCQVLADIFTFEEKRGPLSGKTVAFLGDASCNVARSWALAASLFRFQLRFGAPRAFFCDVENPWIVQTESAYEAVRDADLLYTDVWISMGREEESALREKAFAPYQLNRSLLRRAKADALVLHCLPAYRGKEIEGDLFEERARDIFDQAENRLHVQKGLLCWLTAR
ncbi:ornithine carbamoyltransferase [Methylacidimicrobium tartarophylax]|uniref:Ornithine carbamoyltransferase n=1 Tax=Methylacidimicrobium tartarophylax TaxID=1041768 RepID=A0A5E6M637_9BACT|nr:ornithine carbamoyltransferase [Methylacidimicrobium tartarophylax]VVM04800.1 ornithine carbamoyltransferase [Methylacidimicrobium tartarophylax]